MYVQIYRQCMLHYDRGPLASMCSVCCVLWLSSASCVLWLSSASCVLWQSSASCAVMLCVSCCSGSMVGHLLYWLGLGCWVRLPACVSEETGRKHTQAHKYKFIPTTAVIHSLVVVVVVVLYCYQSQVYKYKYTSTSNIACH